MVSKGLFSGCTALNRLPSAKIRLFAVLTKNEPAIFNLALFPKINPLGLIRNKLAIPLVRIIPLILETVPPVIRVIIFWIVAALLKYAVSS